MKSNNKDVLMTEGTIWKHIVQFSFPLMLGYLFQQLYTTVDSIVVGNVLGKEALAAVGTTAPIVNTMIGFFTGLSVGAGVIVSKYYGAQNDEKVKQGVNSIMLLIGALSIFATILSIFTLPFMMKIMAIPEDVWDSAREYLIIYFLGSPALIVYNTGSAILRAVGDSRRPLLYLIVSSVVNVILDIIFVVSFKMGIAGAAYATIISEVVSTILVLISLSITKGSYRLEWKSMRINWSIIGEMLVLGIPNAIQQSLTYFSNVFVQSYINYFGSTCMAGWAAYQKIDSFLTIPVNSMSMSLTTFVGQNLGAGDIKRAKKGTNIALAITVSAMAVIIVFIEILAPYAVMMYNSDIDVIESGTYIVRLMSPFFIFWAVGMIFEGALSGSGIARTTTTVKFSSYVIFRQIYLYLITLKKNTFTTVIVGYPLGWILCAVILSGYYFYKKDEIMNRFAVFKDEKDTEDINI